MFKTLGVILTWLPKIVTVVILAEPLINPEAGGAEKKRAALSALKALGVPESALPVVDDLIDLVVTVFNQFGIFDKPGVEPVDLSELGVALRESPKG
jgi:hypothetical protein